MTLFNQYPGQGRELIGRLKGDGCRRGYGNDLVSKTKLRVCAYCDTPLFDKFELWLNMAVDHVIPVSVCKSLSIPEDWCEDASNKVLACAACNTFRNRYRPQGLTVQTKWTLEDFYELRDRIFLERKSIIIEARSIEFVFFEALQSCGQVSNEAFQQLAVDVFQKYDSEEKTVFPSN